MEWNRILYDIIQLKHALDSIEFNSIPFINYKITRRPNHIVVFFQDSPEYQKKNSKTTKTRQINQSNLRLVIHPFDICSQVLLSIQRIVILFPLFTSMASTALGCAHQCICNIGVHSNHSLFCCLLNSIMIISESKFEHFLLCERWRSQPSNNVSTNIIVLFSPKGLGIIDVTV